MRSILVGNYGVGNIGDEALKEYFLATFPDIQWTVVTATGAGEGEVPRLPLGLRSLLLPWWRTVIAIAKADVLVFGGGSLFTDIESVWACIVWGAYALTARFFGTPYVLAFQGAGPWNTSLGRLISRFVYRHAAFVSVRDAMSLERLHAFGLRQPPTLSFDPALALFASAKVGSIPRRYLAVIPRANSSAEFFASVRRIAVEKGKEVKVLLMEPEKETEVSKKLRTILPAATVLPLRTVDEFLREMSSASAVLCQRYHGALGALAMGIPFEIVPQGPGDKMYALKEAAASGQTEELLRRVDAGAQALRTALHSL